MLVKERYIEFIFNKIKNVSGGANSIATFYRKGNHYIACIGINLIIVTRADSLVTSLIYTSDCGETTHRPVTNHFKLNVFQSLDYGIIYDVLFNELKKHDVKIEEEVNNEERGVNLSLEEVFGPAYFNLDGYSVCCCNNEYKYNNLKPLGTIIGHILTNQPFSYETYLNNLFIDEDNQL